MYEKNSRGGLILARKNHHTTDHCRQCYLNSKYGKGCKAFLDKQDPLINEQGYCQAKITDEEEYILLKQELGESLDVYV